MKTVPISRDALRIVLFGLPNAGKSSLLGALAQAAQSQEHLLGGRLRDLTEGLAELQRRVYEDKPGETVEEVVPYPVSFEAAGKDAARREAVLIDCDGRVANEILSGRRSLQDEAAGKLADEVLQADALVLPVDAAAPPAQVEADFAEFVRFLRLLERGRGRKSEVGGLPAFLVLTKCDLLARPDDSSAGWNERIEEKQRSLAKRFKDFLERDDAEEGPAPFGRVNLQPWATAVKRPALSDGPARPREPYRVAELFKRALEEAAEFRRRRQSSSRRLAWVASAAGGLVALLAGLATTFVVTRQNVENIPLAAKVENHRSAEGQTPSGRLREPLQPKISVLTEFQSDPAFTRLPSELQDYVRQRLQEMQDYRVYKEEIRQVRNPTQAQNEAELEEIEKRLTQLAPPPEWSQTEAGVARSERLADIKAMQAASEEVEARYGRWKKEADDLLRFDEAAPVPWKDWQERADKLLADADRLRYRPGDKLPKSARVDYAAVLRLRRVDDARSDWEKTRRRLEDLRDLTAALGLAGDVPGRPSLLAIPAGVTLDQARARWRDLEKTYRRFAEWPGQQFADPAAAEVRRAAETSYRNLLPVGQEVVLRQLQRLAADGKETPERWREVREWLASTQELHGWRELATLLARLVDPKAEDVVNALVGFLRREEFDLEMQSFVLQLPDDLKARPAGALTVHHIVGEGARPAIKFVLRGDGVRDERRRLTRYTFVREGPAVPLIYRPGDALWAELPLTKDAENRDRLLVWSGSRSFVYQYERLLREPRLHRKDPKEKETPIADGVLLSVRPENGLPRVPDLMPVVILKK